MKSKGMVTTRADGCTTVEDEDEDEDEGGRKHQLRPRRRVQSGDQSAALQTARDLRVAHRDRQADPPTWPAEVVDFVRSIFSIDQGTGLSAPDS